MDPDLSDLWTPENIYCQWMGVSFVITTTSLLFYHMTRVKSLEMNPKVAGIFAIILIISSIVLGIVSIIPYYTRIQYNLEVKYSKKLTKEQHKLLNEENVYKLLYILIGCCVITIQLGMAYIIIKGSFK